MAYKFKKGKSKKAGTKSSTHGNKSNGRKMGNFTHSTGY